MTTIRLLLTSGASYVGQNVLAVLALRRDRVHIAATGTLAHELAMFDFDAAYRVPPTADSQAFEAALRTILSQTKPDLIIPCRDDDVVWLAEFARRDPAACPPVPCGDPGVARIMRDKWESYEFARRHGLPFAATLNALQAAQLDAFIEQHGFPLIAKPSRGFASRDVLLIANADQARLALARDAYVLQPFLGQREEALERLERFATLGTPLFHTFEGWKQGMQLMIAPDGTLAGMLCARQQMRQGVTDRVEIDPDPASRALAQRCAGVFAAAGWRGPLNIQCQRDADGLQIHEFSGRVTGATEARLLLGYDELGLIVRHFAGCELPDDPRAAAALPQARRTYRSVAPRAATLKALERTGRWSSMPP